MGKRKKSSRKPMGPKKKEKLPSNFQCLFCNHENSVSITLEKKLGVGNLHCKVCGQTFQTGINYLSAAVDVYADWIDACDAVAKDSAEASGPKDTYRGSGPASRTAVGGVGGGNSGGDDFIVEDDLDAEGEYADDE